MLRIMCDTCILIEEGCSGFLKGDTMLAEILLVLDFVPDEVYISHMLKVYTPRSICQ